MRRLFSASLLVVFAAASMPAHADEAPAMTPKQSRNQMAKRTDGPSVEERRLVAYGATGVSAVSLVAGSVLGFLALDQFNCLSDVVTCNTARVAAGQQPIEGTGLFTARAEMEQKSLGADMAFLLAGTSAIVATVGYLGGFVFTGEQADAAAQPKTTDASPINPFNTPVVSIGAAE